MSTQTIEHEDFLNAGWVNQEYALKVLPPTLQWRRGDLTHQNPLLRNGCWQLPVESFQPLLGDKMKPVDVLHAGGVVVSSYLFETIYIAILAHKKRWYVADSDGRLTYLEHFQRDTPGVRSKFQLWALVKELGNEPAIVSVSGMNSKYLNDAIGSFVQRVIKPASRMAKVNFGRHHFWLPLKTMGKIATKNNQYVTPPGLAITDFDTETLRSLFTGRDVAEWAEKMIPEAKEWGTAKEEEQKQIEPMDIQDTRQAPPPPNFDEGYWPEQTEMFEEAPDEIDF